jgi:hypothetical protein
MDRGRGAQNLSAPGDLRDKTDHLESNASSTSSSPRVALRGWFQVKNHLVALDIVAHR